VKKNIFKIRIDIGKDIISYELIYTATNKETLTRISSQDAVEGFLLPICKNISSDVIACLNTISYLIIDMEFYCKTKYALDSLFLSLI